MLAAAPTHHESAELDSITPQIRLADSNNVQSWNDAVGSDTRHPATEASFDSTSAIDNLASGYMILEDDQDGPDTCLDQNANEYESIIDESSVYDPADYQQAPLPLELESHPSHDIPADTFAF
ncbi:hypothetical protein, variant [Batrachochytrium dendrobatidis JEL423]|uniref:Uncharacterized protein n=1 Tax=Batrachochytrium dendrobatidis (strain JEL423) TaxID=403673 RepID=A0A177WA57_BATDL|nr:hypothetical protein, variant [Batrachochytrium dendrobatidis JEL423]